MNGSVQNRIVLNQAIISAAIRAHCLNRAHSAISMNRRLVY